MRIVHGDPDARGRRRRRRRRTSSAARIRRSSAPSPGSRCPTARAASTSTSRRSGCTSTASRSRRASACPRSRCGSTSPASAARSAAARTSRSRSTRRCSRCTRAGPVKMVYNRQESFTGHVHRHPARIRAEHRATRDGRLVCVRMQILLDGGAYASSSTAVTANAASFACGPYAVPNALHRDDERLHEQPAVRRDARLRRRADVLRRRGADGQARAARSSSTPSSCAC